MARRRKLKRSNGEGALYQERGQWVAVISYTQHGRTKRKKVRRPTMQEALDAQAELRANLKKGIAPPDDRTTVRAYLATWLEAKKPPAVRESTWNTYQEAVEKFLEPKLGGVVLTHLSVDHVEAFMRGMIRDKKSAARARYMRNVLRIALNDAMRRDLVVRNVAALVDVRRAAHVEKKEAGYLTQSEALAFFDAVDGKRKEGHAPPDRLAALWTLALALGLRRGELVGLRWIDVDMENGVLHVREQVQRLKHIRDKVTKKIIEKRGLVPCPPKSQQSRRTLRLPKFAVKALRVHAAKQAAEQLKAGPAWVDSGRVFTTERGAILDPRNVLRRFHELLEIAGVQRRRLHEVRHTAVTMLLTNGVDAPVAQEVAGHTDVRTTMSIYGHVTKELHDKAAEVMDDLFGASRRGN